MNSAELQRILVAYDECCELLHTDRTNINLSVIEWAEAELLCCQQINENLRKIIEELEDWASEYDATYGKYLCKTVNPDDYHYQVVFNDYVCVLAEPEGEVIDGYQIRFSDYVCQLYYSSDTKSAYVSQWYATYDFYKCAVEDNPLVTTTSTTSTTTHTTTEPILGILKSATFSNYLCAVEDNPFYTTSTTTEKPYDPNDIEYEIEFTDYVCCYEVATTTTTEEGTTSTTTLLDTYPCGVMASGEGGVGNPITSYVVDLGTETGLIGLIIDTLDTPDKFVVTWNGSVVIDTGYQGDPEFQNILYAAQSATGLTSEVIAGQESVFTFEKTTSERYAEVTVYAPVEETLWSFTLNCPSVATTTTGTGTEYEGTYYYYKCQTEGEGTTTTTHPPTTTTTTPLGVHEITCGDEASGLAGYPIEIYLVNLGAGEGYVTLTYDTLPIPDKFIVEVDGEVVINTGYRGDTALQKQLNDALAAIGEPQENIVGAPTGTAQFYKASTTTFAVLKVYAPVPETHWSFTLGCPDYYTTTSTTSVTSTTTLAPTTTTTTTNAAPVSQDNAITNERATCGEAITLKPSDFSYTDTEGDTLTAVRINYATLSGTGSLTYHGVAVTNGQIIPVIGGVSGSFAYPLVYTPDMTAQTPYSDEINFNVRTANNSNFG